MQAASPVPRVHSGGGESAGPWPPPAAGRHALEPGAAIVRLLGAAGLVGVVSSAFLLAAGAARTPTAYVPGRSGGWPGWLAGPLRGIGVGITSSRFQALMLIMCGSYLLVLLAARAL